jgi:SAM-dependent methyltransferase
MAKRKTKVVAPVVAPEIRLDMGCGQNKVEGFTGVDIRKIPGVDLVFDLRDDHWPWEDDSVTEINAAYLLSYLNSADRIHFMNECGRVLKQGGKLGIKDPHWSCMRAIQDPMFQWPPICETTFLTYNAEWRKNNQVEHYPITCDFDYGYGHVVDVDTSQRNDEYKQYAVKHYNNVVLDLVVTLTKR